MPTSPLARAGMLALFVAIATSGCDAPSILPPRAEATGADVRSMVAEDATLLDVREHHPEHDPGPARAR